MTEMQSDLHCDVLVVGGGINGAGIARDAAGRGLRVILCEKDDLGSHTSSASSKLIHGGLRYLEQGHFALVRKALREREVLLKSAPHIMRPLRFVMPHEASLRPGWLVRSGLMLYDWLAPREFLGRSRAIELAGHPAGAALQAVFSRAFEYMDGFVDDARLVVLCALDARERGALVLPATHCRQLQRHPTHWLAHLHSGSTQRTVHARCLVNASGAWAAQLAEQASGQSQRALRLVKGSHIVVPRLFEHQCAYLFQHPDRRIVFAIPYEGLFTLIGTTDIGFDGDPDRVSIGADEVQYLCALANRYFRRPLNPADVVWSYSGVRALYDGGAGSAARASRDYHLACDSSAAPMLSVFGGKITTFRVLAEQAVNWLAARLSRPAPAWTAGALLPGGDLLGATPDARAVRDVDRWVAHLGRRHGWCPAPLLQRYARTYGTRCARLLDGRHGMRDMGVEIVPGLYEVELEYLMAHEWARCAADVLWRRTKLGLHLPPGAADTVEAWMIRKLSIKATTPKLVV